MIIPVTATSIVVRSNDLICCTKPRTGTGRSPTAIGFGPSFVIIQFTSTAESCGKLAIVPLFRVLTGWISPLLL